MLYKQNYTPLLFLQFFRLLEHPFSIYILIKKANLRMFLIVSGEIKCNFCEQKEEVEKREASRRRLTVHNKLSNQQETLYDPTLP